MKQKFKNMLYVIKIAFRGIYISYFFLFMIYPTLAGVYGDNEKYEYEYFEYSEIEMEGCELYSENHIIKFQGNPDAKDYCSINDFYLLGDVTLDIPIPPPKPLS